MSHISIVVTHATHQITYYDVPDGQGWKVDPAMRCLVIGKRVPRTYVPLDGVLCFELEDRDSLPPAQSPAASAQPEKASE